MAGGIKELNNALTALLNRVKNTLRKTDVVDNLLSTSTDLPLSANQGRVLNGLMSALHPITVKKLWTNSNPGAAFGAQTVSVDLSSYDIIAVVGKEGITDNKTAFGFARKGEKGYVLTFGNNRQIREFTVSATGVAFSAGYTGAISSTLSTNNNYAIPLAIYGIKGVI